MARLRFHTYLAFSVSIILLTLLLSPQPAGAIGFQPVAADELKLTNELQAPGALAIILYRQVDRDDGRIPHEENYFRIKILKEEGRKYADIEIPFFKENQQITHLRARTIRPDGTIVEFTGNAFEKTIVKAKDVRYLAKTFTLTDVQAGSIIEYFYTIDYADGFVYGSQWEVSNELFTKHAKFTLKPYSSYYPQFRLLWNWVGLAEGPKEGPDHIVRMEVSNVPAFETEDFMPPATELKARVVFTYTNDPVVESDTVKFWKRVGKDRNSQLENFAGKHASGMVQAVSQIVSPDDSPEVKAQKIYARVQQLRNTSYEVYRTEEEKKRDNEKPINNVEDLWHRGYGGGVQLTWLYLALARAAGLEAYGVWVSDRSNYFFNPNVHDEKMLDANVVLIHFKNKDDYCDPGAAFIPYGLLPWFETGVQGLRLDKDGGQWIQTPLPDSGVSQIVRKANLKLIADTGSLEGNLTITYTGLAASSRRVERRNDDDTARKKLLEDEVREFVPSGIEVELVNKPDWRTPTAPLVAEFILKVPGWVESSGRRAMFPTGLFSSPEKRVFDHANRVHPLYFRYPSTKLDDISIQLPEGWRVSSLPPAESQDSKIIAYSTRVENNKGILHISRKFSTDILLLDSKYYAALQSFYRSIRTSDEQQIVLLPGTATASR